LDWGNVAQWCAVLVAFSALNAGILQWLLTRREDQHTRDVDRVDQLDRQVTELRVNLPLEYVRREDWIRFSSTIDAKMDSMRDEIREELSGLRTGNVGRN
jgi:hypothetical protein